MTPLDMIRMLEEGCEGTITMSYHYTAAVTLLALLLYLGTMFNAGRARGVYKIPAPAVTGNEHFERAYRVQMNTLEQLIVLLPVLWIYAMSLNDIGAAVGGGIWILGRLIYAFSYIRKPASRGAGYGIGAIALIGLYLGAAYGVIISL